jgi:hypothetical protein
MITSAANMVGGGWGIVETICKFFKSRILSKGGQEQMVEKKLSLKQPTYTHFEKLSRCVRVLGGGGFEG